MQITEIKNTINGENRIISHRGNIDGPIPEKENRPSYIDSAIQLGYDVEVDIRYIDGEFWLGHDTPDYKVSLKWLEMRQYSLWLHCKDIESCLILIKYLHFKCFCHTQDPYVLVKGNFIWVHDLKGKINGDCIIPLITKEDIDNYNNTLPYAVCTDYIRYYEESVHNIQLIIPMSGIGQRFIDAGYSDPKPLIEVDGKTMIEHVVNMFPGIKDITFICNPKHIKNTNMYNILQKIAPNCRIYIIYDDNTDRKGPVHAIDCISKHINKTRPVIVSYCDYGTQCDFNTFLKETKEYDGMIACYKGFHPHMVGTNNYAFCKVNGKTLIEIKEKEPFTDNRMNEYASNGTYYFKSGAIVKKYFKKLLDLDIRVNNEFYVSLVYNLMVQDGLSVGIFEIEKMLQWGTPYDLEIYKQWSEYFKKPKMEELYHNDTTLILPMAGKGSRFAEDGYDISKPLLPVDDKYMVVAAIDCLPICEKNIFICLKEHVENNIDKKITKYKNVNILALDATTEGQAITCKLGIEELNIDLNSPIFISACDNGVYYDTNKYMELYNDQTIDVIVWSFRNHQTSKLNPNMYTWMEVDENNFVKHVSCKNFIYDNPLKTHAIIGTMFFRKANYFIDGLNKNIQEKITTNNEYYVDDVLNQNIKSGLKIKIFEVENYICWGTPNDYKTYNYWKEYFK